MAFLNTRMLFFHRMVVGMAIFFHLQRSIPMTLSFALSQHKEPRIRNTQALRKQQRREMVLRETRQEDHITTIPTEDYRLSPASTSIQLLFGNPKMERSSHHKPFNNRDQAQQQLLLNRLDGIDLYGREIIHEPSDANEATMSSILHTTTQELSSALDESTVWDATLVLQPDSIASSDDIIHLVPQQQASCFVAMNRFHVKDECKILFEERWAQRQSKLSYQPGFVSFSLLRRRKAGGSEEYDRFNYSTCTIWDCIDSWKEWRNGEGRSSHDASRQLADVQKRVPVSEWLQGPSSPIFWNAKTLVP